MTEHPVDQAFVDFVIGAMDPGDVAAFEAHVSACDGCAAKLEREARIELALPDVAKAAGSVGGQAEASATLLDGPRRSGRRCRRCGLARLRSSAFRRPTRAARSRASFVQTEPVRTIASSARIATVSSSPIRRRPVRRASRRSASRAASPSSKARRLSPSITTSASITAATPAAGSRRRAELPTAPASSLKRSTRALTARRRSASRPS